MQEASDGWKAVSEMQIKAVFFHDRRSNLFFTGFADAEILTVAIMKTGQIRP